MADKIYLVSRGSYSDYSVYGAFTSEADADAAIEFHKAGCQYDPFFVEEIPLNPDVLSSGKLGWRVAMAYDTGDDADVRQLDLSDIIGGVGEVSFFREWTPPKRELFAITCYADDETHAIKIANERRAMYKAMKGENDGRDV